MSFLRDGSSELKHIWGEKDKAELFSQRSDAFKIVSSTKL